jgi:hypothetical protein
MQMHEVKTVADKKAFLALAVSMYKSDPNYIRPLDKDIEEVFDPAKNKFFKKGECTRWVLLDDINKPIGHIAAFVNKTYKQEQPTGGVGFFECINDQKAANFMLDHCKEWLQQRGMEAMDGPINFGERDKWWGLIVEGFREPLYGMTYNLPYYKELLEAYGFQVYYDQICFSMPVSSQLSDKFFVRHDAIAKHLDYRVEHVRKNNLEKYAKDFSTVYNAAWASHGGGKSLEERQAIKLFQTMKPVMDEKVVWFTYYKDQPIAMWVNLPDLNQFFKHLNGKFGLLQKVKFLYLQRFGTCRRLVGIVFGVIPRFQGKGIDTYMIVEASRVIQAELDYVDFELQWIGDFNPKMLNIAESLGTERSRKLCTYRYLFDRNKAFKRHPML